MKTTIPLFTITAALLCVTIATAQKKSKTPPGPPTLSVPDQVLDLPGGRITFKQLTIVKCGQFMPEEFLQGIVTNETEHTWEYLSVEAKAKTQRGTDYPIDFISMSDFRPGQSVKLGSRECGLSLLTLPRDLVSWGFFLSMAKAKTDFTVTLVKPTPNDALQFEDASFLAEFRLSKTAINFGILNKGELVARLDWNQAAFVDWTGRSHSVIHQGVKFADKGAAMPPTVIPPGSRIEDGILPADNVSMGTRSWITEDLLPSGAAGAALLGKTFGVFLPIIVDGKTLDYSFTFRVKAVQY
jgi:hypothetical protein